MFPPKFSGKISNILTGQNGLFSGPAGLFSGNSDGAYYPWYSDEKADGINPTLFLDFVNNRYAANDAAVPITDILTVTRSTTKNVFNSSGELESVAIDTPAFDHDPVTFAPLGLLVEEQRTNICPRSGTPFTNWTVLSASKSAAGSNFLGYFTDGAIISSTGAVWNGLTVSGISWSSGVVLSWSLFVKSGTSNKVRVYLIASSGVESVLEGTLGGALTSVDATAGVITYTSNIAVDGGYIYNGTFTPNTTTAGGKVIITPASAVSGETVIFYGFQLEAGAFPTSFISTTTGAVTRGADSVINNASNVIPFADWYNQVEGTVYVDFEIKPILSGSFPRIVSIDNTATSEMISIQQRNTGTGLKFEVVDGGSGQVSISITNALVGRQKLAAALKLNDFGISFDGAATSIDTSGTMPTPTRMTIGLGVGGLNMTGWIKSLRYYPARITNSEIERITT